MVVGQYSVQDDNYIRTTGELNMSTRFPGRSSSQVGKYYFLGILGTMHMALAPQSLSWCTLQVFISFGTVDQ